MKNQGWPHNLFDGRPIIGICNTWSELTPCNGHFRELAESVKRGVWEAGGFPLEFPVMSLGETQMRPTAMLFRNLASMDVEESIRANPIDGVVLLMGCDKTTPALLMGAASCNLPTIGLSGGPMLNGKFQGRDIGASNVWQMSEQVRAGNMTAPEFCEIENCISRSKGHCMTMGTASTMANMVESLGMSLPGNAAIPAVDARRATLAQLTGRRIVEMVHEDMRMTQILTRTAFENAIFANAAIRRIDERRDSFDRACGKNRRKACARRLGQVGIATSLPCEPDAVWKIFHGGLFLRGRIAGGAARIGGSGNSPSRCGHGERPFDLGECCGSAVLESRSDSDVRGAVEGRRGHRGRCAAILHRTER